MVINDQTLLFEQLTEEEKDELRTWAEAVVLKGYFPQPEPPWVGVWAVKAGYNPTQKLLVLSTVLPLRILAFAAAPASDCQPEKSPTTATTSSWPRPPVSTRSRST